jgi:hypothetical protein
LPPIAVIKIPRFARSDKRLFVLIPIEPRLTYMAALRSDK